MTILVTGAYGQLGKELCRQLGSAACGLDVDTLDLATLESIHAAVVARRPRAVINCAAYTAVDRAEAEPELCHGINARAVERLATACDELGCPLVQMSTDYVFGAVGARPWREDDPTSPQGVYAKSKLAGEQAALGCARPTVVRTCGLYARPGDATAKNFVRTMIRLGELGKPLRVVDDQRCTPTYVPHLARALLFLVGWPNGSPAPWGVYHVTNTGETTWYDFAAEIFRQLNIEVAMEPITSAEYAATAARPCYSVLDLSKYAALGGPDMPAWKAALTEYCQSYRRKGE